ncbi:unnamed protein product [Microthlaspi erraticum]|uniref:Uncharacterized protein n=1 Tax=Microthlaspi erraticum TaxID=1685480 RepID=A0A6D2KIK8_9BRAS|nr:unnamed protein product [Microthlaspi erraticum]
MQKYYGELRIDDNNPRWQTRDETELSSCRRAANHATSNMGRTILGLNQHLPLTIRAEAHDDDPQFALDDSKHRARGAARDNNES